MSFRQFRSRLLWKLTAVFCVSFFSAYGSFGFCPQPNPTVACEFLNSDAVFVGTVHSVRQVPPRGKEYDGWLYSLAVQELFRGPSSKTIAVFTENSSGSFPLDVGKQYLLFASEVNGHLEIYNCGNSADSPTASVIRELRSLIIPKDAFIEGRISFSGIPDTGTHVSGMQVVIRSGSKIFKATTDQDGWFHLHVPPGKYSAEILETPQWSFAPYDLSYDNPEHFDARAGHCSGLQFVANSK
jgi:hypothetical protein